MGQKLSYPAPSNPGMLDLTNANDRGVERERHGDDREDGDGKGVVQLGAGSAYFDKLALGIGTTAPDNLLQIRGTS